MHKQLLTLINDLESENAYKQEHIELWFKKNEEKKARIAETEEDKEKWQRKAINYYQMAKSYGIECIIDNDIDETLKEFTDGKV